jgi:D-glycero-alpha-D-manno-heptose 1-phosphate guanylyltransferase
LNAVFLAGGRGTRLQSVVSDRPKPLADINGKPFLYYLLAYTLKYNLIDKIILSIGYKKEMISDYFGTSFQGIPIVYSLEEEPLGTGGAILNSLKYSDSNEILVFNGDSFFELDLNQFVYQSRQRNRPFSIALSEMENFDRYGSVDFDENYIIKFQEKKFMTKGFINTGIYLLEKNIFKNYSLGSVFSIESDFLQNFTKEIGISYFIQKAFFVDIGIPEDYYKFIDYIKGK